MSNEDSSDYNSFGGELELDLEDVDYSLSGLEQILGGLKEKITHEGERTSVQLRWALRHWLDTSKIDIEIRWDAPDIILKFIEENCPNIAVSRELDRIVIEPAEEYIELQHKIDLDKLLGHDDHWVDEVPPDYIKSKTHPFERPEPPIRAERRTRGLFDLFDK